MYSPINEFPSSHAASFDASGAMDLPAHTGDNVDYMRRFSYADLLSNNSESSASDCEQPTPSPTSHYEDYAYFQHAHPHATLPASHPLDDPKRRMSMIEQATTSSYYGSSNSMMDYLSANDMMSMYYPSAPSSAPAPRSLSYSAGDMMSTLLPPFEHAAAAAAAVFSSPATLDGMVPLKLETYEKSEDDDDTEKPKKSDKVGKNGKSKQCRSRGRRVSSHPANGFSKMFTCKHDDCGKVFKRSEHLKRHIRSIHTLEKPFECPYQSCSKRFSRSDNLNQHIRIHRHTTKEKNQASRHAAAAAAAAYHSYT
ncbi:hypothetical protein BC940DRAFT_337320 [Gongronella butleri]|nr:hypothetical protein BC940DRAFT_337320 [Gongronella butleri]